MIIDCISDLHGNEPKLPGGDILIIAGDMTARDAVVDWFDFFSWVKTTPYKHRILIAGNHDGAMEDGPDFMGKIAEFHYLQDDGVEIDGIKFWGSPWTKSFEGMNPRCRAFTLEHDEAGEELEDTKWGPRLLPRQSLAEKWALIPDDTDVLITHSPPFGVLDMVDDQEHCGNFHAGSKSLMGAIYEKKPKLHIFGHIHEGYGIDADIWSHDNNSATVYINASHVNEYYKPTNPYQRIEI